MLLHPVRLRIVQTLLGAGELTTRRLHERLPDVPIATLYRQVGHLVTHGLLEVADERRVGGASEKTYRLSPEAANPSAEELNSLTDAQLLTAFTVFTSGLVRDFGDYLSTGETDLHADRVSFAQAPFWASDEEVDEFGRALMAVLEGVLGNAPSPQRRRRILSTVLMPRDQSGPESAGAADGAADGARPQPTPPGPAAQR